MQSDSWLVLLDSFSFCDTDVLITIHGHSLHIHSPLIWRSSEHRYETITVATPKKDVRSFFQELSDAGSFAVGVTVFPISTSHTQTHNRLDYSHWNEESRQSHETTYKIAPAIKKIKSFEIVRKCTYSSVIFAK